MDIELYVKSLKEANEVFGINNDYLEGKKSYEEMTPMEKADINFINYYKGKKANA